MIVAHLSDLHLGFQAYGRTEDGINVRERDVAAVFERAIHEIIRLGPEVVVMAGDVFDRPDPPAGAVVSLARGLQDLRTHLPATRVLMVAGPRDTPRREGDPGALAVLDTFPNVDAATTLPRSVVLPDLGLHAVLVPYRGTKRVSAPPPEPDPRARWNVLVVHGMVRERGEGGLFVDPDDWDYVALGGEHRRRAVSSRMQYPGALERVALDPWGEAADEKGFLTVDVESGETRFHPISVRPVAALAPIRVLPGDPERLRRRVAEVMAEVPGGIGGKIVRLRLDGVEPEDLLALQGEQLTGLRAEALHLAVEAGREALVPHVAPEDPEPSRIPRWLRTALESELERDGLSEEEARNLARVLVPAREGRKGEGGAPDGHPPRGVLRTVDGEVPGLGRVSTSIPPGLTAIIGGSGRSRRAMVDFLSRVGNAGAPMDHLYDTWTGKTPETLDGAVRQAVETVARERGLNEVEFARAQARRLAGVEDGESGLGGGGASGGAAAFGAVRTDAEQVAAELRSAEREVREVRAEAAEITGDVQAATMDWHRERQDAETTLNAYRDRARELQRRIRALEAAGPDAPCPTCGRVLADHHEAVLVELREEWEAVVQDGSWWKKRLEQLELKPAHLQELESRALRLHAALEAGSERVELLRVRLSELREAAGNPPSVEEGGGLAGTAAAALERLREARLGLARSAVLNRASRFLGRISGGRILAVTWSQESAWLQGDGGPLAPLSEEDLAAGRLAVRLAAATLVAGGGRVLEGILIHEPFDRLDEEARVRALILVRKLLREFPRVVLVCRGDAVDASPELFSAVLEIRDHPGSGPVALRPVAAGPGLVQVKPTLAPQPERRGAATSQAEARAMRRRAPR
ncbi:MAG: hypothetical protein ACE5GJ_02375 [Gemmatimonadota bacterium]